MAIGQAWCINGMKNLLYNVFHGTSAMEEFELMFFSNDVTPAASIVNTDLMEITSNCGLQKQNLNNSYFGTALVTVGTSTAVYVPYNIDSGIEISIISSQSMYGYAIRGKSTGSLYYLKNVGLHSFVTGDTYSINPVEIRIDIG